MAEAPEQRERRLRSIPDNFEGLGAANAQLKYTEHMAFSLWRIANALEAGNKTLDSMGMNKLDPSGPPGAIEMIGIELKTLVAAVKALDPENR